jgi:hypothetical protein
MMAYGIVTSWWVVVSFTLRPFYPWGILGCVVPRAGLDAYHKKNLAYAGIEPLFLGCPGRGLTAIVITVFCLFVFGGTAPVGHGLLIHEVSGSHKMTHHSR